MCRMGSNRSPELSTSENTVADPPSKHPTSTSKSKSGNIIEKKRREGGSEDREKDRHVNIEEFGKVVYGVQSFGQ